jgi:predicted enzyme related to lactoylglutathione lyase
MVVPTKAVDDLDDAAATVRSEARRYLVERTTNPSVGDLARATDPDGMLIGILQPTQRG